MTTTRLLPPEKLAAPRHLKRWLILAAVIVLAALLTWLVEFSSVLGANNVTVTGTTVLSPAQISAAAGIEPGTPLARLNTGAIRDRLAALKPIASVTVHTSYPSTVQIAITERVAVGYRVSGTGAGLVDGSDVEFRTVAKAPAGLPKLQRSTDAGVSAAIAQVAGGLPSTLRTRVYAVTAASSESVTLTLGDGRTVLWGGTDRAADKASLLRALITQPGTYFDISDPSSVISRGAPTGN